MDNLGHSTPISWAHFDFVTETGQVRNSNEDRVLIEPWGDGKGVLAVVADGMGGHRGGEVAAQITIDTFAELLQSLLPQENARQYEILDKYFQEADRRIKEQANQSFKLLGMGATVVAAIVTPTHYLYLHAGDCRLYHFHSNGDLVRRSKDHSVVQVLLDLKEITEEEIPQHPMRSVVNSCLGGRNDRQLVLDPRWSEEDPPIYPWTPGDVLLLSSDGMHSAIPMQELQELVRQNHQNPSLLAEACRELAIKAGGKDNFSLVVISLPTREE